jgi:lysozyme
MSERKQLILDEGLRLFPYKCSKGKITIGIGRNLEGNPLSPDECTTFLTGRPDLKVNNTPLKEVREMLYIDFCKNGISEAEAYYLFENDYRKVEKQLQAFMPWLTNHPEEVRKILINMTFQMGINKVVTFKKMIAAIKAKDYKTAALEMEDSDWYKQTTNRAERLTKRMEMI